MNTWFCLILVSLLSCVGQMCQKQATCPSRSGRRGCHIFIWLGLALLSLSGGMLLWLGVLQTIPVSIAYPMLSLNFVWVTLAARWFWKERISVSHWLGVLLIIFGIIVSGGDI